MARFQYIAVDNKGIRTEGTIEGNSQEIAIAELKKQGMYVLHIKQDKMSFLQKEIILGKVVKIEELVVFTRQLATLIKSGVTIVDSVRILGEQTTNKQFRKVIQQIEYSLRNGEPFSSTLAEHPKEFPSIFINMVRAGETAGNLDETLNSVAEFFEKEYKTRSKVKSAMTYPIVISILATLVTIFLLLKVVPNFVKLYQDYGAKLPLPTRIIIGISNIIVDGWYVIFILVILITVGLAIFKKTGQGRYYIDYLKLKLPIFGKLIQKAAMARFARTLSALLKSAVPILQSLTMVSQVVENEAVARPIREARESLRQGKSLHEPLKDHWVFPPLVTHMIAVGEESGAIDEMLNKVAEFYENDVDTMTDQLKSLIEPLLIVLMAVIVGTIILAVIMPMFGIYDMIGK
ncbi:type II secretion system F family protein [Tepidibacillus sp. LV47]|uniref:type II secretion system F family protein n=1 Tax=Tepidibacillus sp. LV47 TaxID=3398228 RepID=UPI003AB009D4